MAYDIKLVEINYYCKVCGCKSWSIGKNTLRVKKSLCCNCFRKSKIK